MEKLIGNKVEVHLKCDETVSGIMFDTDERHVYIQNNVNTFVAIPRENVKYYVGSSLQSTGNLVKTLDTIKPPEPTTTITVCVNGVEIVRLSVPPDVDISSCNERVLKLIWSSPEVHDAIRGKVQKSLEYDIGYVNITTVELHETVDTPKSHNTFEMNVGTTPSITPFDMVKSMGSKQK